jgi:hypothetical protein
LAALALAGEVGAAPRFSEAIRFPAGILPQSVAVSDLDGDGVPDIVVANKANDVSVLLGRGGGRFGAAVSYGTGGVPRSLVVADFDRDQVPDVATANEAGNDVTVLLGFGDGTFDEAIPFASGISPQFLAAGDLDRDGVLDLVTVNASSRDLNVLLGNGDGSFQAARAIVADSPERFVSVVIVDVDGDDRLDLVAANVFVGVSVLLGRGPCRKENPNVVRMYHKYKDQGFDVYGVSLDRSKADWVQAIEEDGLVWTHVSDLKYFESEAALLYNINAIPFSVLVDPNGIIIGKNLRGKGLEKRFGELFGAG